MIATEDWKQQYGRLNRKYIYRIMIANIEIPTANLGFLTMTSSKKVSTHDFDNDRLPEIGTSNMIAQTGNRVLISLEVL